MQEALKWMLIADEVQPKDGALIIECFAASQHFKRGKQPSQATEDAVRWGRCVGLMRTGTVSAGKKKPLEKRALFPRGFGKHHQKGLTDPTAHCEPESCPLLLGTSGTVMQVCAITNIVLV